MDLDLLIFSDNIHAGTTGFKLLHWVLKNSLRETFNISKLSIENQILRSTKLGYILQQRLKKF